MSDDFSNSVIEQVYDDFRYGNSGFDSLLNTSVKELKEEITKAKDNAKKQHKRFPLFAETRTLSDELTFWLKECGDKISQGFNEASPKVISEISPEFADICVSAVEMNPRNSKDIKKVLDSILDDYKKNPQQDVMVYEAFHKIYAAAFRNTGNTENATAANLISDRIDIMNGTTTPDKYLSRMTEKPTPENLEAFKISWKHELENKPEVIVKKIKPYAKIINNIDNIGVQRLIYAYMTVSLKAALEKEAKDFPEKKDEITRAMISVLDIEEYAGFKEQADKYRNPFEIEMLKARRQRDTLRKVHVLLNIQSTKLRVNTDPNRKFFPTRKEMKKAVNLLDQLGKIEYATINNIMGKIDTQKFTNVDDSILDNLIKNVSKMPKDSKVEKDTITEVGEKLTSIRAQMHSQAIKQKPSVPHGIITEEHDKEAPKTTSVLDIKNIKDSGSIEK